MLQAPVARQIWNGIQDGEGNIVVPGIAYTAQWPSDLEANDNTVIRSNNDALIDMNAIDCSLFANSAFGGIGYLAKLSPTGDVMWCTMLNAGDQTDQLDLGSELRDVVERPGANGPEYWAVGKAQSRPFMVRVDHDGVRLSSFIYEGPSINGLPSNTVSQFVMARSRHTAHRAKRIVSRAFTTSKSSPALGLS